MEEPIVRDGVTITTSGAEDVGDYLALVLEFPLESIRDDAHVERAQAMIDRLLDQSGRSAGQERYLQALTDLVWAYDRMHTPPLPPLGGVEALRYLMDEQGLTQKDLVPYIGHASAVSEILAGKRPLAVAHARRLAERFALPVEVFLRPPSVPEV